MKPLYQFFVLVLLAIIGLGLQAWLFTEIPGIVFWIGYCFLFFCAFSAVTAAFAWQTKSKIYCPHGVRGGRTLDKCDACANEDIAQLRRDCELIRIRSEADKMRISELARLVKLGTHRLDSLLGLSPTQFEHTVAEMYRALGYDAEVTSQSNDYGRDIILLKDKTTTFVECKRYGREKLIGRPALQKFHGSLVSL
jgi:hypothetical protein